MENGTKIRTWDVRSLSMPKIMGARLPDTQKQTTVRPVKNTPHHGKERPDKNGDGDALYCMISIRTKPTIA
jgi:hypothetical protein